MTCILKESDSKFLHGTIMGCVALTTISPQTLRCRYFRQLTYEIVLPVTISHFASVDIAFSYHVEQFDAR